MRYALDPAEGRFTVQAFKTGMLSALGHSPTFAIRTFGGEFLFDPADPADTTFFLTVQPDSLSVTDSVSAKDREEIETRMRTDVLETAAHPEIAFRSSEVKADKVADNWYRLQITGDLRLHGVIKPVAVDVQLRLSGDQARLSGTVAVSQSAHRIKPVSALGGTIKLKDEVKFDFNLVGKAQG